MNWFVAIASYIVIWWIVIFAVLPFGVRPVPQKGEGHDAGAPANPRLLLKAAATTLVAAVLWLGLYLAVSHDLINFRSMS